VAASALSELVLQTLASSQNNRGRRGGMNMRMMLGALVAFGTSVRAQPQHESGAEAPHLFHDGVV